MNKQLLGKLNAQAKELGLTDAKDRFFQIHEVTLKERTRNEPLGAETVEQETREAVEVGLDNLNQTCEGLATKADCLNALGRLTELKRSLLTLSQNIG